MWDLLPLRARVALVVGFTAVVTILRMLAKGVEVSSIFDVAEPFLSSAAITAAVGALLGRLKWVWQLACMIGFRHWYPDLNGTWKGTVTSSFSDGDGNNYAVEMRIEQRWNGIDVETRGLKSGIVTKAAVAVPRKDGRDAVLWAHFVGEQNEPRLMDERRWLGASRLVFDRTTNTLSGTYWTDRAARVLGSGGTAGSLTLTR